MVGGEGVVAVRRVRRFRTVSEKRRIVQLTLASGASVAQIAHAEGVNANQLFTWRRSFERGELVEPCPASTALLPVVVHSPCAELEETAVAAQEPSTPTGTIHIEFPGLAMISVESGADPDLLRSILESLRK